MPDLFNNEIPVKKIKGNPYHSGKGKFSSKDISIHEFNEKEVKRLKVVSEYYKRQCERLQKEIVEVKTKNKELEKQLIWSKIQIIRY